MKNPWLKKKVTEKLTGEVRANMVDFAPFSHFPVSEIGLCGNVYCNNELVQQFNFSPYSGEIEFTPVNVLGSYLVSAEFNAILGLFSGTFNVAPDNTYIEVNYKIEE